MATVALRSPSEKVGGLFYFGRMVGKIRLHARDACPTIIMGTLKKVPTNCVRTFSESITTNWSSAGNRVEPTKKFCSGVLRMGADRMKTMLTFGTNSCASVGGTTKFPKYWSVAKGKQESATGQTFRRHSNSSMPTKDGCPITRRVGVAPIDTDVPLHR